MILDIIFYAVFLLGVVTVVHYVKVGVLWYMSKKGIRTDNRLPHEIFPMLLHWKVGDLVREGDNGLEEFLGVADGKIHTKFNKTGKLYEYTPKEAKDKLINATADIRFNEFKYQMITKNIKEDAYNEYLQAFSEESRKLLT
jgi:hypothetical protein